MSELQAGPELDATVATKVMGWYFSADWGYWTAAPLDMRNPPGRRLPWPYSTDIARAWQVVERMGELGYTKWQVDHDADGYAVLFSRVRPGLTCEHLDVESCCCCWEWVQRTAETAPFAICRAALAVVGGEL